MVYLKHLKVITLHKIYVARALLKSKYIWQALMHDNSKFGITEFASSARFFQGTKTAEVKTKYASAWQHHKGVNKHHWQYWIDWENGEQIAVEMPCKYVAEMICDWIGAGKAYNKGAWTIDTTKQWYQANKNKIILHEHTRKFVEAIINSATSEDDVYGMIDNEIIELAYLTYIMLEY